MAIKQFTYYLHDSYETSERVEQISEEIGEDLSHLYEELRYTPFYEIGFNCEIDTETGDIKVLGIIDED